MSVAHGASRATPTLKRKFQSSCLGVIAGLFFLAEAGCGTSSFPTGTGTATITWRPVASGNDLQRPPQPFAGTIAGIPVTGKALAPVVPAGGLASLPPRLTLAHWTGRFQGHAFSLTVSASTSVLAQPLTATFDADGRLGSQNVHVVVGPVSQTNPNAIQFQGTVGSHHVTGTVALPTDHGQATRTATATFAVAG